MRQLRAGSHLPSWVSSQCTWCMMRALFIELGGAFEMDVAIWWRYHLRRIVRPRERTTNARLTPIRAL